MLDTLTYTKKLEAVGVSREVAETYIQIFSEFMENQLATKLDLQKNSSELRSEIHAFRDELKADINVLRTELKDDIHAIRVDMKELENRLMVRFGSMLAVGLGVSVAFLTLVLPLVIRIK